MFVHSYQSNRPSGIIEASGCTLVTTPSQNPAEIRNPVVVSLHVLFLQLNLETLERT